MSFSIVPYVFAFLALFHRSGAISQSTVSILVQTTADIRFGDIQAQVQKIFDRVTSDASQEPSGVSLQIQIVNAGDLSKRLNHLYLTQNIVCKQLLNSSIAVILWQYNDDDVSVLSAASYALSFYRVPTIGINTRGAEFSNAKYPTFLRTSPPYSHEALVILNTLKVLGFHEVAVVRVRNDVDAAEFVNIFSSHLSDFQIHVQNYLELDVQANFSTYIEQEFEEITSNIIILFAKTNDAETIFAKADLFSKPGKMCIINELASHAKNVPTGHLSVRVDQDASSVLHDAFVLLHQRVQYFLNKDVSPLSDCPQLAPASKNNWIEHIGIDFYRQLLHPIRELDRPIEFDDYGNRISVAYKITNLVNGQIVNVGRMTSDQRIYLDEEKIVWLGGGKKPLEKTLPKYLRVVTTEDPPFVYAVPVIDWRQCSDMKSVRTNDVDVTGPWYACPKRVNRTTYNFCCAGYAIDLLSNLSLSEEEIYNGSLHTGFKFGIHLNDSYGIVNLTDDGYGLTGMVGELDADMADLAIGGLTINPEREQHIDFSEPWLYHGIKILEKWKSRESPMESFLQPMKNSLWMTLLILVLLVGCVIFLLDLYSPFDRFSYQPRRSSLNMTGSLTAENPCERVNFNESMWFVWGVLLNSGVCEKTPRSCSARVLGIVWCGFCMIMVASYTANLAAFLVLDQPEKGLSGITDPRLRNPAANFTFGTVLDTNTYQYFKRHIELSTMHRNMEPHNVKTAEQAVQRLLNGTLDAFIWDSTRLEFEAARNCELRTRGTLFGRSAYGVGLQRNSPWTPHITNAILRLTENGKMEELHAKWISAVQNKACELPDHKVPARLGLTNMRDVFVLVTGGILLGIVMSMIEVSYGRRKIDKMKKRALAWRYARKWRLIAEERRVCSFSTTLTSLDTICATQTPREPKEYSLTRAARTLSLIKMHRQKIMRTDLNFHTHSVPVFCSRCRNLVETRVYPVMGFFAYFFAFLLIVLFLWPCVPIPCFMPCFADYIHVCPSCGHRIGRFRRAAKPRFYV